MIEIICEEKQSTDMGVEEADLKREHAADKPGGVSGESSCSSKFVHQFNPSISAQSGGNVVTPLINGCSISNFNINISSSHQGSVNHDASSQPKYEGISECQQKLRDTLKWRFSYLQEGMPGKKRTLLKSIYTELYIIKGGSGEVNKEHEVRQIETASRMDVTEEKSIHHNQMFIPPREQDLHIRTVITRGVAGIGKTVSTNKFTLDWAEKRENTNLDFVFPLCFRELNLMRETTLSLVQLLNRLFPEIKDSRFLTLGEHKMLFILDGLDESRLSLDFNKSEIVTDVTQPTTVADILINIIRRRLLPSAFVWITSRPVASSQIPLEFIDLVTEVRGFNNSQKDEYFRRKIGDPGLADKVISHVKSCRSLHIMCHIPVFCWMAANVLEKKLATMDGKEMPKSLTQMYIQFLILYVDNVKRELTDRRDSDADCVRTNIISLGKLAFKELEKGHLIFYESDLILNGIKVTQASMFSGVYTQIFSEELTLCQEKMFSFVHLSVQEFFAALYVYLTFNNDNINVLIKKSSASRRLLSRDSSELILYKAAVEKALQCENGHFDIFLRFLLGLSLESSHTQLKHLMTSRRTNPKTRAEIIKHIKGKIRESPAPDRCLNLFHCLNELNDHSLMEEIQSFLSSGSLNTAELSPAQWATLVFVLLTSEEELNEFQLSNYTQTEDGLLRLLPVVKRAQIANLNKCNLTAACCRPLGFAVSSSKVRELDLGNNKLTDGGMVLLSFGLRSSKLETLRLRSCSLTEKSSAALASVLSSASCQLKVLDLSDNDFLDRGVQKLCGGLGSPYCKLETLLVTEEGCTFLASALNSSRLRELDLSFNHPGHSGLELLSALEGDPQCSLQKLSVEECGESRIQPGPKKYTIKLTLDPNTAHTDLFLEEDNRKATRWTKNPYPDHPERFDYWTQVLCTEGLTGRCYWETEWCGRAFIGVAYKRMDRKGENLESWLGRNDCSWGLYCSKNGYRTWHNARGTLVNIRPDSNKVGVYLDWSSGVLSFYMICCGALILLRTFHTTFTEPVYPGFWLGWVDSVVYLS